MAKVDWLEELKKLSSECAPEGWRLESAGKESSKSYFCKFHRYDEKNDADLYVRVHVTHQSDGTLYEVYSEGAIRGETSKDYMNPLRHFAEPEFFQELEKHIPRGFKVAERINRGYTIYHEKNGFPNTQKGTTS